MSPTVAVAADASSPTSIDDLPDVVLVCIFHRLEWVARLNAEAVCRRWRTIAKQRGWTEPKVFSMYAVYSRPLAKTAAVLSRCGQHIRWLNSGLSDNALYGLCPNICHLQLRCPGYAYQPLTIDVLSELYAGRLKSLSLDYMDCITYGGRVRAVPVKNSKGDNFIDAVGGSLEYLRISAGVHIGEFPNQLHCLEIIPYQHEGVVSYSATQFLGQLADGAQFPELQSLSLGSVASVVLSPLRHLLRLAHLMLYYPQGDRIVENSLIEILPHLHSLKSLVLGRGSAPLLEAISRECGQLEHLGWNFPLDGECETHRSRAVHSMGTGLTRLRSLDMTRSRWLSCWGWLEAIVDRGKLEYLDINGAPPADLLYKAIEKCPKLRAICVTGEYSAAKMATAAATAELSRMNSGGVALPRIYCTTYSKKPKENLHTRVVFYDRYQQGHNAPKSHVLRHYRDGCLSEGRPRWDNHH